MSKQHKKEAYSELVESIIALANKPTKEKCQQAVNDAFILYMMANNYSNYSEDYESLQNNLDSLEELEVPTGEKIINLEDYKCKN